MLRGKGGKRQPATGGARAVQAIPGQRQPGEEVSRLPRPTAVGAVPKRGAARGARLRLGVMTYGILEGGDSRPFTACGGGRFRQEAPSPSPLLEPFIAAA